MKKNLLVAGALLLGMMVHGQGVYQMWGVTGKGGVNDRGVIYNTDASGDHFNVVYEIKNSDNIDGINSLLYVKGKFYGSSNTSNGILFVWDPQTKLFTQQIWLNWWNGQQPIGKMTLDNNNIYGLTRGGGNNGAGVIYEWNIAENTYTKKFDFGGQNGALLENASLEEFSEKYYGVTFMGGLHNEGVIFEWDPASNFFTKKFEFDSASGRWPKSGLTFYNGKFYGLSMGGGANNYGVIFEWDPVANSYHKKIDLTYDGVTAFSSLTLFKDKFYGTACDGATLKKLILIEWDPSTNIFKKRLTLDSTTGGISFSHLELYGDKLYGTTYNGGVEDAGVLFEWDPVTNIYTKKKDFEKNTGSYPYVCDLTHTPAPVSPGLPNSCITGPSITIDATNNNQWVSIIDDENNAVAEIKANGNNLGIVTASMFINSGAVRKDKNNKYYLDRSITISPQVQPKTPVDVRLYIKATEYEALKNAANIKGKPNAIDSINDVKIYPANIKCSPAVASLGSAVGTVAEKWENDFVLSASVCSLSSFFFAPKTTCAPPVISNMLISTDTLWPPLHSLRGISVSYKTSGDCKCDPVTRWLTVKSNEPISGTGSGDKSPDWIIKDANHVYLRAERSDRGTGRIYTITINAKNTAGAVSTYDFTVTVPLTMPAAKAAAIAAKEAVNGTSTINETMLDCIAVPNPSSDYFTLQIQSSSNEKIDLSVLDMSGRVIEKQISYQNKINRIGDKLKPGVYMIKVIQGDQQKTIKLVKQ